MINHQILRHFDIVCQNIPDVFKTHQPYCSE